jgi:hypothetical protein
MNRYATAAASLLLVFTMNQPSQSAPRDESSTDIAEAEVIQVIAVEDDGYRFRAYLVEWNGATEVVSDPLSRSNFEKGAKIQFMVHKHRLGRSGDGLLGFMLTSDSERDLPIDERQRHGKLLRGDLTAATTDEERFYALGDAAKNAFNAKDTLEATKLAIELELLAPTYKQNWNYGNAVQVSNQVLGRIALADGDIEEAKRRLLASADSEGSPQMNSFGPNMLLAKELLKKGERETVLEYFKLCGKFWDMGEEKLAEWSELVKQEKTPDFGANLKY